MLKGIKNKIKQNKIGKLLMAGILSAVVILTALPITVKADEPTIDFSETGSITIHKYEYNGNSAGTGTGASTDQVPQDVTPLAGVTFKIAKVYDITDSDAYYTPGEYTLPTVDQAKTVTLDGSATTGNLSDIGDWKEVTTTADGTATIDNLSLGIYLVQETAAPAQITEKTPDFLVSIPMTNADGTDWLYNVHVFPKNSSKYNTVSLYKEGKIGSGIESSLPDVTFVLQRKNADGDWETITTDDKGVDLGTLTTDTNGIITVADIGLGEYRFIETAAPNGYIMDGAAAYGFTIEKNQTGDVEITYQTGIAQTDDGKIKVTNYKPNLVKQVKNSVGTWGNAADYSVAETIPYLITLDIPSNVASLGNFTVSDSLPQGMKYNNNSLKIYTTFSNKTLSNEKTSDFTITQPTDTNNTWQLQLDKTSNAKIQDYADQTIYIYYEAQLTNTADNTSAGNVNTATLTYSHEILPAQATDPLNPNVSQATHTDTISDQAVVYTFKLTVDKIDGTTSAKLADVEFDLYRTSAESANGTTIFDNPHAGLQGTYEKLNTTGKLTTDANGAVSFNGLGNGTYYLVETKTVDNATGQQYNLLKNPVKITINSSYTVNESTTTTTTNGATATATTLANTTYVNTGIDGVFTQTVKNYTGFLLPATGGVGTVVFVFIGVSMMVAAVILFVISRKKNREEKQ